jgi:hypothetical protein
VLIPQNAGALERLWSNVCDEILEAVMSDPLCQRKFGRPVVIEFREVR